MWFLFRKEITAFFSSFTGYLVVVVFLVVTGLVLWLLPGELNIPGGGVASLDGLFRLAPWLLLLLIPAVTMRSFAEERQRGTLPLLLIRPVSRFGLVAAKVLASWVLVMTALLPCGVFVLSVWCWVFLPGNMDTGAVLGAFLGLVLMAWLYTALGVLCSLKAFPP
jgi:ABC-2 type transport system permease protein